MVQDGLSVVAQWVALAVEGGTSVLHQSCHAQWATLPCSQHGSLQAAFKRGRPQLWNQNNITSLCILMVKPSHKASQMYGTLTDDSSCQEELHRIGGHIQSTTAYKVPHNLTQSTTPPALSPCLNTLHLNYVVSGISHTFIPTSFNLFLLPLNCLAEDSRQISPSLDCTPFLDPQLWLSCISVEMPSATGKEWILMQSGMSNQKMYFHT